jgi:hypothetical protein
MKKTFIFSDLDYIQVRFAFSNNYAFHETSPDPLSLLSLLTYYCPAHVPHDLEDPEGHDVQPGQGHFRLHHVRQHREERLPSSAGQPRIPLYIFYPLWWRKSALLDPLRDRPGCLLPDDEGRGAQVGFYEALSAALQVLPTPTGAGGEDERVYGEHCRLHY